MTPPPSSPVPWRQAGHAIAGGACGAAAAVGLGAAGAVAVAAGAMGVVAAASLLGGAAAAAGAAIVAVGVAWGVLDWAWPGVTALGGALTAQVLAVMIQQRRLARARRRTARAIEDSEAITRAEARFRRLLESAPDAIVISSADGRIVRLNAEAERLFGYSRDELVGREVELLMPDRFRARHARHFQTYLARPTTRRMGDGSDLFGLRRDGVEFPIETNLSMLSDEGEGLVTSVIRDLTPRRDLQEREALLMRELNHRVKNSLASVQAIVDQTLRAAPDPAGFRDAVEARLIALSQSHDVLTRNDWAGATVPDIVARQLAPYARGEAPFHLQGPDVTLRPNRAVTLGMVIGELATNAAKFGALSSGGAVTVTWRVTADRRLILSWPETGGPPAAPPIREGFGTRLVKRSLSAGLQGQADLTYAAGGLTAVLDFPLLDDEA